MRAGIICRIKHDQIQALIFLDVIDEKTIFHMIAQALSLLQQGELVVIPTETVYGLAADAANLDAVRKIFALKGRPADHPVIVHIEGKNALSCWARDIPDSAYQLADAFWPGPLTLILKKQTSVNDLVTGGQDSVGLRAPLHPLTQQLLAQFKGGLAAPSANRFGHVSPTQAAHVQAEFGPHTPFILEGGPAIIGVESTIISLIKKTPTVLRPGGISLTQIEAVLQQRINVSLKNSASQLRAPGLLDSHYAPRTPLIIGALPVLLDEIEKHPGHVTVLIHHTPVPNSPVVLKHFVLPNEAIAYARLLYATLRAADDHGAAQILMEKPTDDAAWLAINDRLQRAAYRLV